MTIGMVPVCKCC